MKHQNNITRLTILIWYSLCWAWVFQTNTIRMTGVESQSILFKSLVFVINVTLSCLLSYWFITKSIDMLKNKRLKTATQYVKIIATLLPLLALMHYLTTFLPALFWLGPQGSLDNVFPFTTPALLIIGTPLAYSARLLGLYGISAILSLIFCIIVAKKYKLLIILILFISISSIVGWAIWKNPTNTTETSTIIMSEHIDDRNEPLNADTVDLILFPEYGLDEINESNITNRITNANEAPTYYIGSEQVRSKNTGFYNRRILGHTQNGTIDKQDKYRLIPGGEDLPYLLYGLLKVTSQQDIIQYFNHAKYTIKGDDQLHNLDLGDGRIIGATLCSSIISTEDYRNMTNAGATILTNSASLATFNGSHIFAWQQKSLARFMAISNARYLLQSANTGPAFAIDSNGKTIAELNGIDYTRVTVTTNSRKTLYTILGEWLVYIGALLPIYSLTKRAVAKTKKRKTTPLKQ